jgi:hypothetical protein
MPFSGVPAGIDESTIELSFLFSRDCSSWPVGETEGGVVKGCAADDDVAEGGPSEPVLGADLVALLVGIDSADLAVDEAKLRRRTGRGWSEWFARRRQRRQIILDGLVGL